MEMKGGDTFATQARGRADGRQVAVTEADWLRGQLASFRRKEERALRLIEQAARPVGIAFSGGKDSTVTLDLVRRVFPDAIVGFYDSGAELQDTLDLIAATTNVQVIPAGGGGLIELCKQNGYWGHEPESPTPQPVDFAAELIYKPAREFVQRNGLQAVALGLRADEAVGRRINARTKGEYYHADYADVYHLCPVQFWTEDEIWAYIAKHDLPYNRAYDAMTALGIPRAHQRICTNLGTDAASFGRYVYLKQLDPGLWNRLAREFPLIRKYA